MIAYIDAHRDQFGVEFIWAVLRAAAEHEAALTGTSHPASQPTPALATK